VNSDRMNEMFSGKVWAALGTTALAGLFIISQHNYLLFHTLAELFSIAVAWAVFMLMWNTRHYVENEALVFVGAAYFFIGLVDLAHTLAYKGIGVFDEDFGSNLPTQLWIAARYMESSALLAFSILLGYLRTRPILALWIWAGITALFLLLIFYWRVFPVCYVEGAGLTLFKKGSEYIICLVLLTALAILHKKRGLLDRTVYRLMAASMLATLGGELAFTLYVDVYGLSNLVGHFFKIVSFVLIYLALIRSGLTRPFALLFRELEQEKAALRKSENLFRKVFDILPVGLWIADENGKVLKGNPEGAKIWGPAPLVDQPDYGLFKARRLPSGEEVAPEDWALAHTVNNGVTVVDELLEIDAFDGQKKTILNFTAPVLDDNGHIEAAIVVNRDVTELKRAEAAKEKLIHELQDALAKVKKLSGMLPICASCKKIRDDQGYWTQIEAYIRDHSEADFSHSICPECAKKLYPDFYEEMFPQTETDKAGALMTQSGKKGPSSNRTRGEEDEP